mgnify:CR=1 FL=1
MAREIWVYVEENQKEIELVSYELLGVLVVSYYYLLTQINLNVVWI